MRHLAIVLASLALASPGAACESVSEVAARETVVFACPDNPLPKMEDRVPVAKVAAVRKPARYHHYRRHYRKRK